MRLPFFRRRASPMQEQAPAQPVTPAPVPAPIDPGVQYRSVRHAFGLDVSDRSLKAVEIRRHGNQSVIVAHSFLEIPLDVVQRGVIQKPEALAEALRTLLQQAVPRPMTTTHVVFSVGETSVFIHPFEFPHTLSEAQVRRAVPYEAEGELPITLKESYVDLEFHRSRDRSHHVLFAAAGRELIDTYVRVLRSAGLEPVVAELESLALARALVPEEQSTVLVVDTGGVSSTITTVERRTVHGAVSIPIGGVELTRAVAEKLGCSAEEAERQKQENGLESGSAEAKDALRAYLEPLVEEIQKAALYHQSHTGRPVERVILSGGGARLKGLSAYLKERLQRDVLVGDPFTTHTLVCSPSYAPSDQEACARNGVVFATAIGLALRGAIPRGVTRGMNVLPPVIRERYAQWSAHNLLAGMSAGVVAVLLGMTVWLGVWAVRLIAEQFGTVEHAASVRQVLARREVQDAIQLAESTNTEVNLLQQFDSTRADVGAFLEDIRRTLPPGILLTSLVVTHSPEADAPLLIELSGIAAHREAFVAFADILRKRPQVSEVRSPITNFDRPLDVPFVVTLVIGKRSSSASPSPSPLLP